MNVEAPVVRLVELRETPRDVAEVTAAVTDRRAGGIDVFVGTVAEKLLTYAIGRRLESDDMPAVRAIVRDAQKQNYRVSALIMGVATSAPLRLRQVPARAAEEASP